MKKMTDRKTSKNTKKVKNTSRKTTAKVNKPRARKPRYGTKSIGEEIEACLTELVLGKEPTDELVKATKAEIRKISKAHFKAEQYDTFVDVWPVAKDVYGMILFRDRTWPQYATVNFSTNVEGRTQQGALRAKLDEGRKDA